MRLRQLKISGFKSFADTTLIEFPGNLAGIVGPNGCGKSNVIDAIRWVLGEGRISELRGSTSMSELIFSGSANRPASSRASVEMVLDNSDGSITGPWGAYSELSIKRVSRVTARTRTLSTTNRSGVVMFRTSLWARDSVPARMRSSARA